MGCYVECAPAASGRDGQLTEMWEERPLWKTKVVGLLRGVAWRGAGVPLAVPPGGDWLLAAHLSSDTVSLELHVAHTSLAHVFTQARVCTLLS